MLDFAKSYERQWLDSKREALSTHPDMKSSEHVLLGAILPYILRKRNTSSY